MHAPSPLGWLCFAMLAVVDQRLSAIILQTFRLGTQWQLTVVCRFCILGIGLYRGHIVPACERLPVHLFLAVVVAVAWFF